MVFGPGTIACATMMGFPLHFATKDEGGWRTKGNFCSFNASTLHFARIQLGTVCLSEASTLCRLGEKSCEDKDKEERSKDRIR